MENNK